MFALDPKGRPGPGRPSDAAPKSKTHRPVDTDQAAQVQDVLDVEHEREVHEDIFLQRQRDQYDFQMAERTEQEREYNNMRDLMLAQMKQDDDVLKKFISMI